MEPSPTDNLSRRERQIMDVVYRLGEASAAEIQENLPSPPSYSAVRAQLVILEEKGALTHVKKSRRYIYRPTVAPHRAKRSALRRLLSTFYGGSAENLVASLLDPDDLKLPSKEIDRIRKLVEDTETAESSPDNRNLQ